jgi:hypothetical protein
MQHDFRTVTFLLCLILGSQVSNADPYTDFVTRQKVLYLNQRPAVQNYTVATVANVAQKCTGGVSISAGANNTIVISGNGDCTIQGLRFNSDHQAYGLQIWNHKMGNITIKNNYFNGNPTKPNNANHPINVGSGTLNGKGILIYQSSNISVDDNHFEEISYASIYAFGDADPKVKEQNIKIKNNKALNAQLASDAAQWKYQSYFVAFLYINGSGNEITDNKILNAPGNSFQTDVINIFQSEGEPGFPITVKNNVYFGPGSLGYYNHWGAGIQLGDHLPNQDGGKLIEAKSNLVVEPGQAGININGGDALVASFNLVQMTEAQPGYEPVPIDAWTTRTSSWTPMSLLNYQQNDTSVNKNHKVRGNHTYCSNCTNTIYNATPTPTGSIISDNRFDVPGSTTPPLLPISLTDFAGETESFMADRSCTAQIITWNNEKCFAQVNAKNNWVGLTIQAPNGQGAAYVACQYGKWALTSNWCNVP